MKTFIQRALVACTVVAVALTSVPSVAAQVGPLDLPEGPASSLPWYDTDSQTFHFGATSIPSPAGQHMRGFRLTDTGILIDNGQQLIHLTASGETRVVLSGNIYVWAVRTGTYAGRQVAASVGRSGVKYLEVRRISDGSLVRRTRLQDHIAVHGFHNKRVWYEAHAGYPYDSFVAHTFNVVTGHRVFSVVRTPSEHSYVNVRLNALGVSIDPYGFSSHVRFRSLTGSAYPIWSRPDFRVESVSPDRQYVLTSDFYDDVFDSDPARLQIRNARTGALLRELPYSYWTHDGFAWEDNDTVVLSAVQGIDVDNVDYVTVRTDMDGNQERIGNGHGDGLDGPHVIFPLRR